MPGEKKDGFFIRVQDSRLALEALKRTLGIIKKMKFMKLLKLSLFIFLFSSCDTVSNTTSNKKTKCEDIIYILPNNVTKLLKVQIDQFAPKQVYFCLHNYSQNFEIFISELNSKSSDAYITNTNRKVFIEGLVYPLIFEFDNIFGTITTKRKVIEEYNKYKTQTKVSEYIIHHGYSVKFDTDGTIISDGYE